MYKAYRFHDEELKRVAKRAGFRSASTNYQQYIRYQILHNADEFINSGAFQRSAMERNYLNGARRVVFIDPPSFHFLLNLRFSVKDLGYLFKKPRSTMICLNANTEFNGVKVPSHLHNIDTGFSAMESAKSLIADNTSTLPEEFFDWNDQSEEDLRASYIEVVGPMDSTASLFFRLTSKAMVSLINQPINKIQDPDFISRLTSTEEDLKGSLLSHEAHKSMILMARLSLAFNLYNTITDERHLINGCPNIYSQRKKLPHRAKTQKLSIPDSGVTEGNSKLFLRSGFYRQLVADRYYQGAYSHMAPGSRFVLVKPTLVGKGLALTQDVE